MKSWERTLIHRNASLREALQALDAAGSQILLVVDEHRRLLGSLTDGDVRRGLLKGLNLSSGVATLMHAAPTCAYEHDARDTILSTMRGSGLHQIPVIRPDRTVVGLAIIDDYLVVPKRDNWVIVMAGGLGSRLHELTRDTPKPMLKVGSRPLLETIVLNFVEQGFSRFWFAVNYKAEQIEAHFGDGRSLGVDIRYLREQRRMGTAGALSLLPERPSEPFIVTNADLLAKADFGRMLDQHVAQSAGATMAVRQYEMQVPFGVVRLRDNSVVAIEEKPVERFLVNAGIYVMSPPVLELVPADNYLDMPALFDQLLAAGVPTQSHMIDGYWRDIGRLPDFERANQEFHENFR